MAQKESTHTSSDESTLTEVSGPSQAERFFFDNNGYLILEDFLKEDHVNALTDTLLRVIAQRRELQEKGIPHTGNTNISGERSARILYILDDDPLFLEMLDWPPIMPYVTGLLNERPHHHSSDAFAEYGSDQTGRGMGWHIDGHDNGYRDLGTPIPLLQLKIGYYLNDMTTPGQGNIAVVPGSHKASYNPDAEDLKRPDLFPGAVQICAPPGAAILFHNALWHSAGPFSNPDGCRLLLYYAYEQPWMVGSHQHWGYSKDFYNDRLAPEQRKLFHGFLFDPPEERWG